VTEGVLVRRLLADPELRGAAAVVLDEFHERHWAGDLALALLSGLRRGARPDLKVVVMSATLEADPVREFLERAVGVRSEGRLFDVRIEHLDTPDERPLAEQVASGVRRLVREEPGGDVLVFLPGAGEIRRAAAALEPLARSHDLLVLPLHGDLPPAEQNRAVRPADRRKVILSTNVAETSVTIEGVVAVVDSGLARVAGHSPWTGLSTLRVAKISQASAVQRAGRAGRTRPGRALRLYSRHDFETRRPFDLPEVMRVDLAEPALVLHALGVRRAADFAWFESPPSAALAAAEELLRRLSAIDGSGALTPIGRELLRFPLHPRLARLVLEGERRGVGREAATLAAIISEGDIAAEGRARFGGAGASGREGAGPGGRGPAGRGASGLGDGGADLLERLDRFEQAAAVRFARDRLSALGLDGRAVDAVDRARRQIQQSLRREGPRPGSAEARDEALAVAVLASFPDRVARRRAPRGREIVLAGGGAAEVGFPPAEELLVAVDAEARGEARARGATFVRLAVGVQAEALVEALPGELEEETVYAFDEATERVARTKRLRLGAVVLEESRRPAEPSPEASRVLAEAVRARGLAAIDAEADARELLARLACLREALPEEGLPAVDAAALAAALAGACEGKASLDDLRAVGFGGLVAGVLPARATALLAAEAPQRLVLPGGRAVRVRYEEGKPPWIESRLQDFFGSRRGPTVCRGRVAVVLHLLAPNGRAVQVTRDLEGFWRQHYPALRRELGRRYPRHSWPEDGATARAPAPRSRAPGG
jgi:ATP-dependent helicase HrpB